LVAVIGTNLIAAYLIAYLREGFVEQAFVTHLSAGIFHIFGADFESLLKGAATRLVLWLYLNWIHQQNIFLWVVSRRSRPSGRSDLDFSGRPKAPRLAIALELCRPKRMLDVVDILPRKTEDFNPAQFVLFIYNIN